MDEAQEPPWFSAADRHCDRGEGRAASIGSLTRRTDPNAGPARKHEPNGHGPVTKRSRTHPLWNANLGHSGPRKHPPALRPVGCSRHSGQPQICRRSSQRVQLLRTGTLRQQVIIPSQSEWPHAMCADRFRDLRHSRTRQRSSKEGCPSSARPMGRLSLRQRTAEPCLQSHSP